MANKGYYWVNYNPLYDDSDDKNFMIASFKGLSCYDVYWSIIDIQTTDILEY